MDIFFIASHAGTKENAEDYIEATRVNLDQNSNGNRRIQDLTQYIFPIELKNDGHYKKFGIEEVFTSLVSHFASRSVVSGYSAIFKVLSFTFWAWVFMYS